MASGSQAKDPAAVALGRLGGLVRSPLKAEWARWNGRKGGRPRHDRPSRGALQQRRRRERLRAAAGPTAEFFLPRSLAELAGQGDGAPNSPIPMASSPKGDASAAG